METADNYMKKTYFLYQKALKGCSYEDFNNNHDFLLKGRANGWDKENNATERQAPDSFFVTQDLALGFNDTMAFHFAVSLERQLWNVKGD